VRRRSEHRRERHKRPVAHGASKNAVTTAKDAIVRPEGRPQIKSGTFPCTDLGSAEAPLGELPPSREFRQRAPMTRAVATLAWPIAAAMLGETAIGLVDTKLVGGLGTAALGGTGLGTILMYLGYALSYGAMRGVKVRVSHAIGEGRPHHAISHAKAGLGIGVVIGLAVFLACRDVGPILVFLRAEPAIIPYARDFLAAVTWGAPSTCALAALVQYRQGLGDSRTPMVVGLAGNAFNALCAWSLIYGRFGLPALGVRGAGISTAITETLELAIMLLVFLRDVRRPTGDPLPLRQAVRDVNEIGIPTGVQYFAETLAFTAFTVVLGTIGTADIAAHQIALNVIRVSFLPGLAVAEATSVLVGQALGRRRPEDAEAAVSSGLKLGIGFMATCGVVFVLLGGPIARTFSSDDLVVSAARRLLLVAAAFQVLDATNIVLRGALRAAKDARVPALIGAGAVWICLPTAAFLLGRCLGLGALGGWLGFIAETSTGATLLLLRWRRGAWRKLNA
jgi:multidrug resistance protein, MATE family